MVTNKTYKKVRIAEIIKETSDSATFILEAVDAELNYKAGQYITFVFPKENGKEDRRSYSFSSSPDVKEPASITVKQIPNGEYSRMFMRAKVGDEFYFSGVHGFFTLPEQSNPKQNYFFIAAGSGIVPIFSLIKQILWVEEHSKVTLTYSSKSPFDTIFFKELTLLSTQFPERFKIYFLFSEHKRRLSNSLLGDLLMLEKPSHYVNHLFYVCGPFDFMETVFITLLTEGIQRENIRREHFNHTLPQLKNVPPDRNAHDVLLKFNHTSYSLSVQYPKSILSVALEKNIPLPYSCQSGQCGSCAARLLKGNIWMSDNEVLTQKELDAGLTLTCTGFPLNSDVVLSFDS